MSKTYSTFRPNLIYIFRITGIPSHQGCLKIGMTTLPDDAPLEPAPNSKVLNDAARERIKGYTATAGIQFELLYTESAIAHRSRAVVAITDHHVHDVLERSGIERVRFGREIAGREWYRVDLQTAIAAIAAAKAGQNALSGKQITRQRTPIEFRPEQIDAIEQTCKKLRKSNRMLWNAKMRFGKTLSALEVVQRMGFQRTIILTHRPVVKHSWHEDFDKIFYFAKQPYVYSSKTEGPTLREAERDCKRGRANYLYFASMQDLRGSRDVGGKFNKNNEVFSIPWDFVIVDEAHEGTQTQLGKNVLEALVKDNTKVLQLSGTPFNLFDQYKDDEIYTWDYIMEQQAKAAWEKTHCGDANPYAALPTMNIYTFDLGALMEKYMDMEVAFNFTEFFRTSRSGDFVHEDDVRSFLRLITKPDPDSMFPFANPAFRDCFHHTLWMVPGVSAGKALSALLQEDPIFGQFKIVNVAGEGDEDAERGDALELVRDAIEHYDYTITLSCGRLTTGVSVPEWTAVMMLAGGISTAASSYMQTIFRVQTPATIDGQVKENCYVFDFAPDRTLRVVAESIKIHTQAGKTTDKDRQALGEFLNYCPVVACEGSRMVSTFTPDRLLERVKRVYVERIVQSGFDTGALYNEDLLRLSDIDLKAFSDLKGIIGATKAMPKTNEVDVNKQGLTEEEYEEVERLKKKKKEKKQLTPEEEAELEKLNQAKKNRYDAISILRGISIRMPLLIYGAELTDDIRDVTIDNFTDIIDDLSWQEFMPHGVTKEIFAQFKKYYDPEIFLAAGRRIRALAEAGDRMSVEQRIERIAMIFNSFRNPDKETVLTPWRTVNRHLADTLGGYCFYDHDYNETLSEPRYREIPVTARLFHPEAKVLEVNSKSGLYPLYAAYSIYRAHVRNSTHAIDDIAEQQRLWDRVIEQNIFVICKTKMAKSITRRTLLGFRYDNLTAGRIENLHAFDDLLNRMINEPTKLIEQINKGQVFKRFRNMQFDLIIGNPPYQIMDGGGVGSSALPVYQHFLRVAKRLNPAYISLIMPSRWMTGGKGLDDFRDEMLSDTHIRILHDYADATECFSNVEIKGGVCYFLWDKSHTTECHIYRHNAEGISDSVRYLREGQCDIYIRENILVDIYREVHTLKEKTFDQIVSARKPYGLTADVIKSPDKYGLPPMSTTPIQGGYTLLGLDEKLRRILRYLPKNYPITPNQGLNKYKIFISKAYGNGELGEVPATPVMAPPGSLCTETFIQFGPFDTEVEMRHCASYMRTKFFRTLVGIRKQTQNTKRDTYSFVPLQDFTSRSPIDWDASIEDIDKQLYAKYDLTEEEKEFINRVVTPMPPCATLDDLRK